MPVVLATGSLDHRVRLWDATSGVCIKALTFEESQINCLQISPDKKHVAVGGNPFIHIYEVNGAEDKPVITYDGHTNNVTTVGKINVVIGRILQPGECRYCYVHVRKDLTQQSFANKS